MHIRFPRILFASASLLLASHSMLAHADVVVSSEKDNSILQLDAEGKVIRSIPV